MSLSPRLSRAAPWAGLVACPVAWGLHHQLGAQMNFWDCAIGGGVWAAGLGIACGLVCAAAGLVSWRSGGRGGGEMDARRFIALCGAMAGGAFLMAIVIQTLAALIVPACHR